MLLLRNLDISPDLRNALYHCNTVKEWDEALKSAGIPFQEEEFEEAVNMLHVRCQTVDEADDLLQRVHWVRMMLGAFSTIQ